MRTSGGRGTEGWMAIFPIVALLVGASLSLGGVNHMMTSLEGVVRDTVTSVVEFVGGLF